MKPMSVLNSLPYFAISSVIIYLGLYKAIPYFMEKGMLFFHGYLIFFYTPFVLLFITALILYRKEGNEWNWKNFRLRLRLTNPNKTDWVWAIGMLFFGVIVYGGLSPISKWLCQFSLFTPPDFFPPEINPTKERVDGQMMAYTLSGQYWIIIAYLIGWFFNIFGEEFLWRGIILPRQIVRYGNKAWIYHGLIWTLWHFFWKWNLIAILPFSMAISYCAYKRKNTWIPIFAHGLLNFIPLIMIIVETMK